jgi:hypothetical protein
MTTESPVVEQKQNLAEGTVMLNLSLGQVSNRKKIDSDTAAIDTEIDKDMLHVGVDLYDSKELRACQSFLARMKLGVKSKAVPSFFRGGIYLVKHEGVEEVHEMLNKAIKDFEPLVDAFAAVAEERKEESRSRLGPAFNAAFYPTPEAIKSLYSIKWNWFTMQAPDSLKKINSDIYEREIEKAEQSFQTAATGINTMLAAEAKKLVEHMVERLTPGPDGKAKVFKRNSIEAIQKFLDGFSLRDIGTTEELQKQVSLMGQLIEGVDPKSLRQSDSLREDVSKGFKKVAKALDAIVIEKPKRFIDLTEAKDV